LPGFALPSKLNYRTEQNDVVLNEKMEQFGAALGHSTERLDTVLAELQHQMRNLISLVGTIADSTMRTSETFDDFKASYRERLKVLPRAQGLLFRKKEGDRVTSDEPMEAELSAHSIRVREDGPVTLDGPKGVRLDPVQFRHLRWSCTNLSLTRSDTVHLSSRMSGSPFDGRWKLWVEVANLCFISIGRPNRPGQGRELIERALPYQFDARTTFARGARMASIVPFRFQSRTLGV
jgi:two-component system, chemotaxis family, CheB/CheR fusion protein